MEYISAIDSARDESLRQALWLAATLGPFRPADLLNEIAKDHSTRRALAPMLAAFCDEVAVGGTVLWNLGADARRRAFQQMKEEGILKSKDSTTLFRALLPRPEDDFGRYLREALNGAPTATARPDNFEAHYAAYEFVGGSEVGVNPSLARQTAGVLSRQVQFSNADKALVQSIGPNFVGRTRELGELRRFSQTSEAMVTDAAVTKYARRLPGKIPMIYVTGVGGTGKSALIAKLAREMREQSSGVVATVVIDFDRPSLSGISPIELSNEFLRQLAMCVPLIASDVAELARTALSEFSNDDVYSSNLNSNYNMFERAMYSINARLRDIVPRAGIVDRPVLVILDTFEEVLTLGAAFVWRIYRWLQDLHDDAGLKGIRVILSGRATPADVTPYSILQDSAAQVMEPNLVGAVQLGDLKRDALDLLSRSQISATLGRALIATFGRNPLVLRLLSDYAKQEGINPVRQLLRDDASRQRYKTQVAQRVLYSRILYRIREDPALRVLASPGLIVRVVTPGIIQNVLAVPCGIGAISNDRALDLFQKLARQVWLVKQSGELSVSHRRDMRAVMLQFASEPGAGRTREDLVEIAVEIHVRARDYHLSDQVDPGLTPESRREEALYHQLFIDPDDVFQNLESRGRLTSMAGDLADFPLETRARLKRALGRSLRPSEIRALDEGERAEYFSQLEAREVSRTGGSSMRPLPQGPRSENLQGIRGSDLGETKSGISQLGAIGGDIVVGASAKRRRGKKQNAPLVSKTRSLDANSESNILAAYARAEFDEIANLAPVVIMRFFNRAVTKSGVRLNRDMTDHVSWIAALSTLSCSRKPKDDACVMLAEELTEFVGKRRKLMNSQLLPDQSRFSLAHYATAVCALLRFGQLRKGSRSFREKQATIPDKPVALSSVAALRIFQAAVVDNYGVDSPMPVSFVNADSLQYFARLVDTRSLPRRNHMIISAQSAWVRRTPALEVVHKLVDKLASSGRYTLRSSSLSGVERSLVGVKLDLYDWEHPRFPYFKEAPDQLQTLEWAALRGMSRDLQAPLLAAVREKLQSGHDRRRILDRLAKCSGAWPVDFGSRQVGDRRLGDTFVASITHLADRFSLLPVLLEGSNPGSICEKVERVYLLLQRFISGSSLTQSKGVKDSDVGGDAQEL